MGWVGARVGGPSARAYSHCGSSCARPRRSFRRGPCRARTTGAASRRSTPGSRASPSPAPSSAPSPPRATTWSPLHRPPRRWCCPSWSRRRARCSVPRRATPSPLRPAPPASIYSRLDAQTPRRQGEALMTTRRFPKRPSLESMVERVDQQRPGDVPGDTLPTGFPSIDRILGGGLRRRDLVVLGGDVGSGKSALALGLAVRTAQQGTGVALFSGEMDEERLMERALAIEGRATVDELRSAKLNDQTRAGIGGAAVRLRDLPLTTLPLAAADFETAAERLDPLRQLGLVVVDYLQLVPSPRGVARSTQDEDLALGLQRLKALALERRVAVVVRSQLPPFDAERPNARPALDDFGHLGASKQHADVVLGIYREAMYNPGHGVDGATELIVLKNRNGPTGFVDLYFYRRWMRFEDMLDPDR